MFVFADEKGGEKWATVFSINWGWLRLNLYAKKERKREKSSVYRKENFLWFFFLQWMCVILPLLMVNIGRNLRHFHCVSYVFFMNFSNCMSVGRREWIDGTKNNTWNGKFVHIYSVLRESSSDFIFIIHFFSLWLIYLFHLT